MKTYKLGLLIVAMVAAPAAMVVMSPKPADAVPAYTRKYGMDCTVCHFSGTNRLTKIGKEFLWRGQRFKDAAGIGDDKVNIGDYMSFASKVRFEYDKDAKPKSKFDVEALSIYSGGPLYDNFSYFFEIYLHERGKEAKSDGSGTTDTAVREKLAEAYLFYNSNPGEDAYSFLRAGQYTPRIIHQASTGGRVTLSRPLILNDADGSGNLFTPRDRFYGITGGSVSKDGLRFEVGVTNGGGGNKMPNQPENNDMKDWFGSIEKDLDEFGSYLGFFGYSGAYPVSSTFEDKFQRYGFMGAFERENFEVSGGYFMGRNKVSTGGNRNPKGYFLEAATQAGQGGTFYGRIDRTDFDLGTIKDGFAIGYSQRLSKVGRAALEFTRTKATGKSAVQGFMFELNWLF